MPGHNAAAVVDDDQNGANDRRQNERTTHDRPHKRDFEYPVLFHHHFSGSESYA